MLGRPSLDRFAVVQLRSVMYLLSSAGAGRDVARGYGLASGGQDTALDG